MRKVVYPESKAESSVDANVYGKITNDTVKDIHKEVQKAMDIDKRIRDIEFGLSEPNKIQFTEKDGKVLAEIPVDELVSKEHNDSLDALTYALKAQEEIKPLRRPMPEGYEKTKVVDEFAEIPLKELEKKYMDEDAESLRYALEREKAEKAFGLPKDSLAKSLSKAEENAINQWKPDMVNHPPHYNVNGFEVIDIIKAFTEGLNGIAAVDTGNAIKYILRWYNKNGVEDLKKARWYINHLINLLEGEGEANN